MPKVVASPHVAEVSPSTWGQETAASVRSLASLSKGVASPQFAEVSPSVLGYEAARSAERLFALHVDGSNGRIYEIDPDTGAAINSFPTPTSIGTNGYQGLALGPSSLFFVNGSGYGPHTLYELDPATGAVIDSDLVGGTSDPAISSLAYLNDRVYLGRHKTTTLVAWDPVTDQVVASIQVPDTLSGGLTGARDLGLLFGSTDAGKVISISPADGTVINRFSTTTKLSGGLAYVNGQLLGAALDSGNVYRINPSTGGSLGGFVSPGSGKLAGLAGDGATPAPADIRGSVWSDSNGNRQWDDGEPGLEGWTVFLDDDEDGILDPEETFATTGENGSYTLVDVPSGIRLVSALMPSDWMQTYPGPSPSQGRLFALWVNDNTGVGTIVELSPTDGSIVNQFPAPGTTTLAGVQGLAVGPDRLYYIEGKSFVLYELTLDSGAVIDTHVLAPAYAGTISGLAWFDGVLHLVQQDYDRLMAWDPTTETILNTRSFPGIDLSGSLTGAAGEGLLFCGNASGQIFGIDPQTGAIVRSFSTGLGQLKGGMAYLNDELIVGAFSSSGTVYRVDPVSGNALGTLDLGGSQYGLLAGLGGDGAVGTGTFGSHFVYLAPGLVVENVNFGNSPINHSESLYGSDEADVITVTASDTEHVVTINGERHVFDPATVTEIHINALGGNDRITIIGTDQNETVVLTPTSADVVVDQKYRIYATSVEHITVDAAAGIDQVTLTGSAGSNRLYSYPEYSRLIDSTQSFSHRVDGFETVSAEAPLGGCNYAFFYGSPENDLLDASPGGVQLDREDGSASRSATGFERVYAYATQGGADTATLTGGDAVQNRFYSYPDYSILTESKSTFYFYAQGFDSVAADSPGTGYAYAYFYDSPGVDAFEAAPASASFNRADSWSDATAAGFQRVYAYSTRGGADAAVLTGAAAGGNRFTGYPTYATLTDTTSSFYHYASGFRTVKAYGSEADTSGDRAYVYDSADNDTFYGRGNYGQLYDTAQAVYHNEAWDFDLVYAGSSDDDALTDDTIDVDESLVYNLIQSGTW
jgi:hypothetical protein